MSGEAHRAFSLSLGLWETWLQIYRQRRLWFFSSLLWCICIFPRIVWQIFGTRAFHSRNTRHPSPGAKSYYSPWCCKAERRGGCFGWVCLVHCSLWKLAWALKFKTDLGFWLSPDHERQVLRPLNCQAAAESLNLWDNDRLVWNEAPKKGWKTNVCMQFWILPFPKAPSRNGALGLGPGLIKLLDFT